MSASSIVASFIDGIKRRSEKERSLSVLVSNDSALDLCDTDLKVQGFGWECGIDESVSYDFVWAGLPIGMSPKKQEVGDISINLRANWVELWKALGFLSDSGICVAVVEPPAFGMGDGPKFLKAMQAEGYFLQGVFNAPARLFTDVQIRPVIVVIGRSSRKSVFVAELEDDDQALAVAGNFLDGSLSDNLHQGMALIRESFDGFESLKARLQMERLETQYKDYKSFLLGDLSEEMNSVRSGQSFSPKENAIYVPLVGALSVTSNLDEITVKHQNLIQVVLSKKVNSRYMAAFFQSDLGELSLRSLTRGAVIPRINKSDLAQAQVALPGLPEQEEIVASADRLQALTVAISKLKSELALNPHSASEIRAQAEGMLETIGGLTESDQIMSMIRQGESVNLEFKQSFSLDVKKGTKEKYIEIAALKTIVAFLNTRGGTLLIGVADEGDPLGVDAEVAKLYKGNEDKFLLGFKNQLKDKVGEQYYPYINHRLVRIGKVKILRVDCESSTVPCFLGDNDFYVRTNPATDKLEGQKLLEYVNNHFNK